jgi:uroporphyrinogen decarboxylase
MPTSTLSKKERYLLTVRGEETDRPPIWIMRQAGRYMPEYMELRKQYNFRDFCLNPEVSAAATLLPLRLLDIDIMIIFNDILIPLEEMGIRVEFPEGGPKIMNPLRTEADLANFRAATFDDPPVAQALRRLREQAGPDFPVLGFCGSPFTLALYAVEGRVSRNQDAIKRMMYANPALLHQALDRITDTAVNYMIAQVEQGGADGLQVFESWGGTLAVPHQYEEFAAAYQRRLITRVKKALPEIPIHLYVRQSSGKLPSMAAAGADVIGVDWSVSLAEARQATRLALQGNLDPMAMLVPDAVEREVHKMVEGFDWRRGWIANLGHGITPEALPAAAVKFVQAVQSLR